MVDEFVEEVVNEEVEDPDIRDLVIKVINWEEEHIHSEKAHYKSEYKAYINNILGLENEN